MRTNEALRLFTGGYNCAQSVLAVFCEKYNLDMDTALKLSSGFGSGFRSGEVCGAVSGAVLAIGLKYGHNITGDSKTKANCYAKTEQFIGIYKERNSSIICRELLGCDISLPQDRKHAQKNNLFQTICTEKIKSAVEILEELDY